MRNPTAKFFVLPLLLCQPLCAPAQEAAPLPWPRPVPCRTHDGTNNDLFLMTLGNAETTVADGVFDPVKDEVRLKDGTLKEHYFRDTMGLKFYKPMDKTRYPLPPSGWCTWYYYYSRINETEVKRNTDWIAANLKDYGAQCVQIDDGWQGAAGTDGSWIGYGEADRDARKSGAVAVINRLTVR